MNLRKQLDCKHENVVEGPQHDDPSFHEGVLVLGDEKGMLRVCKACGFAERGWTHQILKRGEEVPSATEEECKALQVGPQHHSSTFDWYYPEDRRDSYVHEIRKAFK